MSWKVFRVSTNNRNPSVNVGINMFVFNPDALNLLEDVSQFHYARFLINEENWKTSFAVQFLKEYDLDALPVQYDCPDGLPTLSIIDNGTVSKHFYSEEYADHFGFVRYKVEKVEDNILAIID